MWFSARERRLAHMEQFPCQEMVLSLIPIPFISLCLNIAVNLITIIFIHIYIYSISNEQSINRSLLHWMKLWDYVVFGKNVPKPTKKGGNPKEKFKEKFKGKKPQAEVMEELDKNNCPQQKVCSSVNVCVVGIMGQMLI